MSNAKLCGNTALTRAGRVVGNAELRWPATSNDVVIPPMEPGCPSGILEVLGSARRITSRSKSLRACQVQKTLSFFNYLSKKNKIAFKEELELFCVISDARQMPAKIDEGLSGYLITNQQMKAREAAFEKYIAPITGDATNKLAECLSKIIASSS